MSSRLGSTFAAVIGFGMVDNSYEQDGRHYRDTSDSVSDISSIASSPTTSPTNSPTSHPNLQRRASESISEPNQIQFRKMPVRRYTLPSKMNPFSLIVGNNNDASTSITGRLSNTKIWESNREDSSVQEHVQFGL
ncbi:5675_t:CDS:2 [Dentiscutata erythropus]|uniref:5675_t:CDS:1 n=1 Tax=Dentiscutata erythropus TaxID=1348616 RepID=A0A9N8W740_9GLOM|nr:5675_t:CDS:2 [Dentiscutata erythropus]